LLTFVDALMEMKNWKDPGMSRVLEIMDLSKCTKAVRTTPALR
jgi:hypothetical protein